MKKLIISGLICLVVMFSNISAASAKGTGVVDLGKIIENYTKAQEVTAELRVKEEELKKFLDNAQKRINEAKTPVEKKNLEEKLAEQFNIKRNAFAKEQTEKWKTIEGEIFQKIKTIAEQKKYELVLSKQSVIIGGNDFTEEIIKQLNEDLKK